MISLDDVIAHEITERFWIGQQRVELVFRQRRKRLVGWGEQQIQAAEIQSAVAAIAMALTQRDPSKNHFQSIHAELHRRFKAKSYSLIRVEQYAAVLAFLETWERNMDAGGASDA